ARSEPIITCCRGRRSAITPPTSSVEICASVRAANTSPVSVADPVRSRTAKASAIGTTFVPKNEIVLPAKSSRKLRTRSGVKLLVPVAAQPEVTLPRRDGVLERLQVLVRELGLGGGDELVLRQSGEHPLGPPREALSQLG